MIIEISVDLKKLEYKIWVKNVDWNSKPEEPLMYSYPANEDMLYESVPDTVKLLVSVNNEMPKNIKV